MSDTMIQTKIPAEQYTRYGAFVRETLIEEPYGIFRLTSRRNNIDMTFTSLIGAEYSMSIMPQVSTLWYEPVIGPRKVIIKRHSM